MHRISKWKLALIIAVFVFSALYLLPTIPGLYGKLYGYFNIWMQDRVSPPDVQSSADGDFIRFVIPDDLPMGVSVVEASNTIQDIVERRLSALGAGNKAETLGESEGSHFSFVDVIFTDLYIKFTQPKIKADLEEIITKLDLGGEPPLVSLPPELPTGEHDGSIKLSITKADVPSGKSMQETVSDIQTNMREQLIAQEMTAADFTFSSDTRSEVYVKFSPKKNITELNNLISGMHLYGGIPIALRPIFPNNVLKQGLDLKGGFHIVQELDVKKAMDMYLDTQAKDVILGSLKSADILCREDTGVKKTLEKQGVNAIVVRPYASETSGVNQAQAIADMKGKLTSLGFSNVQDTSVDGPELKANMSIEQDIGDLIDNILDGKNPLIVTVSIRQRLQGVEREDYLDTAEETLDKLELFDEPRRLQVTEKTAIFSVQLSEESAAKLAEQNIDMVMRTLENRINKFGVAESTIRRVRNRPQILIQVPEEQNPSKTLKAITDPAILSFKMVVPNPTSGAGMWMGNESDPEPSPDELPSGTEVRRHSEGGWRVLYSETFMGGQHLKSNSATVRQGEMGQPEVIMFLNGDGRRKFAEVTGQHVGEYTAILLDDIIHTNPRISEKISTSSARITGDFTEEEADYLAKILKAGSFPAPMKSAEERTIGPTLGKAAISRGKMAFTIGISLVVIFMLIYYKLSGAIVVIALLFNFQIILAVLAGLGAALTLPGMAGLILTVGMSVDANVLILERIREELRSGKTIRSSIDSGYQKAFWTILDANVTTGLTALVLYEFGTGPIKGFAVTLSIGILVSMFTALFVTREIYRWIYNRRSVTKLSI